MEDRNQRIKGIRRRRISAIKSGKTRTHANVFDWIKRGNETLKEKDDSEKR